MLWLPTVCYLSWVCAIAALYARIKRKAFGRLSGFKGWLTMNGFEVIVDRLENFVGGGSAFSCEGSSPSISDRSAVVCIQYFRIL